MNNAKDPSRRNAPEGAEEALLHEDHANLHRLAALKDQGVRFPCGVSSVYVGEDVDASRIEAGVELYPGARVQGKKTLIRAGAQIGVRGPCVVQDMVLDRDVVLGSGFFERSVLLKGVKLGASVRVREDCLLEEGCELSFSVDVKHTFLLAHVVLGSEINFCDLLMAGGTSRQDHSEVGSGVIHFNFTPFGASGDKVTASLIGDAMQGVFYRAKRIFVGGHSSLIGPIRIGYGSVVAAGSRVATDVGEDTLSFGEQAGREDVKDLDFLCYKSIKRKVSMGVEYVAQLAALWHWYDKVRSIAARGDLEAAVLEACLETLAYGIETRLDRLDTFHSYMDESRARNKTAGRDGLARQQAAFRARWPEFRKKLAGFQEAKADTGARDAFMKSVERLAPDHEGDFVSLVRSGLSDQDVEIGKRWLASLVQELTGGVDQLAPSP
ncbi:MAG: LbetaH domain-containing protein [Planctomycetota bacterium]|jgi:UDP-N-acetylglucosamine/UDP-N-acetylgalactosamine diphosphorylase